MAVGVPRVSVWRRAVPPTSLTGPVGSTAPETLAANVSGLNLSTDASVCAGDRSCTATNQVRYVVSDLAGNTAFAGPFSVTADESYDVDARRVVGVVEDADGTAVGSFRCQESGGAITCNRNPDGTLQIYPELVCQ